MENILAHTQVPCRLLIVDQGSEEPTRRYLSSIPSSRFVQVEILWNPVNVGFPKGMNIGLRQATAPYVCFLNNDILVPPGWLEELLSVAESDSSIGLVNPSSNTFGIHPPEGMDGLAFSRTLRARQGQWTEVRYGEGFCLLGCRALLQELGGFDETTYRQIYFEDADLGRRVQARGLRCVMAEGTYVRHHEGQTMGQRPERLALFQENERRFLQKWGRGRRVLFALRHSSDEEWRWVTEEARREANRSGQVWIYLAANGSALEGPKHLSIRVHYLPAWQLPWRVLWKTLTKKKGLERIVTDRGGLNAALRMIAPLRGCRVEPLPQKIFGPIAQR